MNDAHNDIQELLKLVEAGRLDALSPEQITLLEARVNADPELAAVLEDQQPPVEPWLAESVEEPDADAWENLWQQVDGQSTPSRHIFTRRFIRLWAPLSAVAAACVLMVGLWSFNRGADPADWPVEWADSVEINELEVSGDRLPLVMAAGSNAVPVIWVLENGG
ncbi:MAG: hypothetical protein ABIG44_10940 [Planctomycetota bacterium]